MGLFLPLGLQIASQTPGTHATHISDFCSTLPQSGNAKCFPTPGTHTTYTLLYFCSTLPPSRPAKCFPTPGTLATYTSLYFYSALPPARTAKCFSISGTHTKHTSLYFRMTVSFKMAHTPCSPAPGTHKTCISDLCRTLSLSASCKTSLNT